MIQKLHNNHPDIFPAPIYPVGAPNGGGAVCSFLDGPAGTGKMFVENILLYYVRSKGQIALSTAYSGIAAQLLQGGRTAHSRFKVPRNLLLRHALLRNRVNLQSC